MPDKLWNAKYWADRIEETTEELAPIRKQLNDNLTSTTFSVDEMFRLRRLLQDYASYSALLSRDMAEPDPKPIPRYKRLFKR